MKKNAVFNQLAVLLCMISCTAILHGESMTDLNGVAVSNAKIPFYNRNVLQSMIFADKAEYRAQLLYGYNVVIDMLRKNVDPDRISNDWKLQLYPLNADLKTVVSFWKKRLNFCEAVISSPEGALDQRARSAAGDKEIQMRSPMMDLNGIGFAADFKNRQIKVNSDVHFVLRTPQSDPRKLLKNIPEKYEFLTGHSDLLHLDSARNRILLLGKVEVNDGKMKLLCDRLTLVTGAKEKNSSDRLGISGITEIYADGNVKVEKILPPNAPRSDARELHGDHLVYNVAAEELRVTGDKKHPSIVSGNGLTLRGRELVFFRSKRQLIVPADCWMRIEQDGVKRFLRSDYGNFNFTTGICDFLGNVRGSSQENELVCRKMRVFLKRNEKKHAPQTAGKDASPLSAAGDLDSGSMEFDRALCRGNVFLFRKDRNGISTLNSDDAELNYSTDKAVFSGHVKSKSGGSTLETARLQMNLRKTAADPRKRELISAEAAPGVKITGSADAKGEYSVLTARQGFFDYLKDRIDFTGDVVSKRGKSALTSDRLELFLAPSAQGAKDVSIPGVSSGAAGTKRTLKNVIATGNAVMNDDKNRPQSDRIEYIFVPAGADKKEMPGLFQSGSLRLAKVICDGNVVLNNRVVAEPAVTAGEPVAAKAPGAGVMLGHTAGFKEIRSRHLVSDMNKLTTVFSQDVKLSDGTSKMDCEKLELFAKRSAAAQTTSAQAKISDIDDDPFDLPAENSVPSTIAIGNGLELDRAIASDNVVLDRRDPSGKADGKVYCSKALFESSEMTVVCTGTPEERPKAVSSGKTHEADKFVIHLKDERIESIGEGSVK
ncbi:MAG: hypothetical protein IKA87_06825 [Lentisphaeria bacterium]|nr:hypothetical protein [Lentisphaeria bacterium]